MNQLKASVVICCYTEERLKDIREAVESVLRQTLRPHEVVLAVDRNRQLYERLAETYRDSMDARTNSINFNQSPIPIRLVLNEGTPGLSETRNVAISASSGDVVAFIDDDAVAEPDWLENLIRPFESPVSGSQSRVVAVGGRAIPLWPDGKRPSWFPEELDWVVGCTYKGLPVRTLTPELRTIRNVHGCNMAFRKDIFQKAGLFRSETGRVGATTGCGEEADLCLRISRVMPQSLIVYQDKAIIWHKVARHRTTLRYLWQRSYNEGLYKAKVQKLHRLATGPTAGTCESRASASRLKHTALRLAGSTVKAENKALSTEGSYLRHLLVESIPKRLGQFSRRGKLCEAWAIILSVAGTGMGYIWGKVRG
jgi:glycosyltransferase involved in cell wall biosynthesis